jgi:hypothetical protein
MIKHPAWLGAALVAAALTLAACGSGASTSAAGSSQTQASTAAPATSASPTATVAGSNTGSDFCTQLKQSAANFAAIGPTFAKTIQAGNFAADKQVMAAFFQKAEVELARIESTMTSAPANVQASLVTVNKFYLQLISTWSHATSMSQLGASMVALGKNAPLKAADDTLRAYEVSQCGS